MMLRLISEESRNLYRDVTKEMKDPLIKESLMAALFVIRDARKSNKITEEDKSSLKAFLLKSTSFDLNDEVEFILSKLEPEERGIITSYGENLFAQSKATKWICCICSDEKESDQGNPNLKPNYDNNTSFHPKYTLRDPMLRREFSTLYMCELFRNLCYWKIFLWIYRSKNIINCPEGICDVPFGSRPRFSESYANLLKSPIFKPRPVSSPISSRVWTLPEGIV